MRPNEINPLAYLIEFVFRSKWNVVGLILGFVVAYAIWHFVEPIREKIVLAVMSYILIRMLANTGSTAAKRCPWRRRPSSLLMRRFILYAIRDCGSCR